MSDWLKGVCTSLQLPVCLLSAWLTAAIALRPSVLFSVLVVPSGRCYPSLIPDPAGFGLGASSTWEHSIYCEVFTLALCVKVSSYD